MKLVLSASLLFCSAFGAICVQADAWTVDKDASTVMMYATKQGQWFDGVFHEFTASISFDPADPGAGTISGVVQTASIDTQDEQNDTFVAGYLEVEAWPQARFQSEGIAATAEGFRATGQLTLKGVTKPAVLDFTFTPASSGAAGSAAALFYGAMTINRFDFGIAPEIDSHDAGQDVAVRINLSLEP